jgi:hypothetical protein
MGAPKQDPIKRFWAKVQKDEKTGCWLWTAAKFWDGYGLFKLDYRAGKHFVVRAHRHSFFLAHGRHPADGMLVCHTCDTPACVNPAHLFEGTVQDNVRDSMRKGRWDTHLPPPPPSGQKHPNSVLTDAQVKRVRALFATGRYSQSALAAHFGCSQQLVSRIVRQEHR